MVILNNYIKDVKADSTSYWRHIGMPNFGDKANIGWFKWIWIGDLDFQLKSSTFIWSIRGTRNLSFELKKISSYWLDMDETMLELKRVDE